MKTVVSPRETGRTEIVQRSVVGAPIGRPRTMGEINIENIGQEMQRPVKRAVNDRPYGGTSRRRPLQLYATFPKNL